jgi:hypothetical protein
MLWRQGAAVRGGTGSVLGCQATAPPGRQYPVSVCRDVEYCTFAINGDEGPIGASLSHSSNCMLTDIRIPAGCIHAKLLIS